MEFIIDLGSFHIEADNQEHARRIAREMIDNDPSWAKISGIELS